MTDIIDDDAFDTEDLDTEFEPDGSVGWSPYREPATLSIAGMAIALVSFISGVPTTLASVFIGETSFFSLQTSARATSAAMALLAAVGLGFGLGALRAEREETPSWVRPLAAAAVLVAGLAILLAVITFVVTIAKNSTPTFPDFVTGGD